MRAHLMRPPDPRSQSPGRQGRRQTKERTHRLDNPEPTPQDAPTSKETPVANATNGPATNGPTTNGGTAPATATRREAPPAAPSRKYYTITELNEKKAKELAEIAKEFNVEGAATLGQQDLITRILQAQTEAQGNISAQGLLEIVEDGFGFLRRRPLLPSPDDVYVGSSQVRRLGLRTGDFITGQTRPPKDNEKYFSLLRVEAVNGMDPEVAKRRPHFEDLTPVFPDDMFDLEIDGANLSQRLINLVNPLGLGQRALIVSPPKAGKTTLLKDIANGIAGNHPDVHIMVVLVGERPEEVTDIRRSIKGEAFSSTFDEPTENHTRVAELALERAKRLVETGRDEAILLDSITRLARAYNLAVPPSGRTLSGGLDPVALYPPKRFFGAARNIEGGGSLSIFATCLVDTGSRIVGRLYEVVKGHRDSVSLFDQKLQERRTFPAINIPSSSTRREELLLPPDVMRQAILLRKMLSAVGQIEGTELLLQRLAKTKTNKEFLAAIAKSMEEK